jgi:hypothetical protein
MADDLILGVDPGLSGALAFYTPGRPTADYLLISVSEHAIRIINKVRMI